MPARNLFDLVSETARSAPERAALRAPGRAPTSFASLAGHVRDLAGRLAGHGLRRRSRIVLALPDGAEAVVATLTATVAGVAVPLPVSTPEEEADRLLGRLGPEAVIVAAGVASGLSRSARRHGLPVIESTVPAAASAGRLEWLAGAATRAPEEAAPEDDAVVLHTSGTTSQARRVALTHAQLLAAGRDGMNLLRLGPDDHGLCFAPIFHLAGLYYAIVYPMSVGGGVFVTPGFDPTRFADWFAEAQPTYFGGSPTAHQAILDHANGSDRLRGGRLRFIRTAAAPLPEGLDERLEAAFGVPVLDGYALTEGGLVTSFGLEPASRRRGTVGRPVADAEVRIVDAEGAPLPIETPGEIVVRGAKVMKGYDDDPEATRAAFFGDWLRTGDEGVLEADGFLRVTGRLRERVNRGGEKISPPEVDDVLRAHPAVAEATAFGVPHPRLGEDLAAAIVLRPGAAASAAELRAFVAARLAPFKVPSRLVFVERIPRGPTGKVPRARLATLLDLGAADDAPSGAAADGSDLELAVAREMAVVLGRAGVGLDDDFFELGGDSVSAAALVVRIAGAYRVELPPSVLFEAPTPRTLAPRVERTRTSGGRTPLIPLVAVGEGPPLFFVHAIGGGVLFLRKLASRLGERPFYGLQAPGFDGREPPVNDIGQLATRYVDAIERHDPDGPYLVGGFCMGAAVAFEMARMLEARGGRVANVVMLDPPPLPLGSRRRLRDRLRVTLNAALARLRGRTPGPVLDSKESPIVRAHRIAVRRYRPGRVKAPLSLVFSDAGSPVPALEAEYSLRKLTSGSVAVGTVSGQHGDLLREPVVGEVAAFIRQRLRGLPS
jgi:acyl-CoA synthetase (AMP-forming)/AMP-acid ligase II/thioesterase domain-containing protein